MVFRHRLLWGGDPCGIQPSPFVYAPWAICSLSLVRISLSAIALSTFLCISPPHQPAWATPDQIMLELPLSADANAQKVLLQAESMVSATLDQRFSQDSALSTLEVVILGNQNGQILPMLTTTVSREQWVTNPQVELWSTYSNSFAALFYPSRPPQVIAARPPQPQVARRPQTPRPSVRLPERFVVQIEQSYDEGRLSRQQLNQYVDLLD